MSERAPESCPGDVRSIALGLLIVVLDLRIGGFDLVPDALGWLLLAGGAFRLRSAHPAYHWVWLGASVMLGVSCVTQFGGVSDDVLFVDAVLTTVVLALICAAGAAVGAPERRASYRWVLRIVLVAGLFGAVVGRDDVGPDSSVGVLLLGLGVAMLVAVVWLITLLWADGRTARARDQV